MVNKAKADAGFLTLKTNYRPICDIQVAERHCSLMAGFDCEADF